MISIFTGTCRAIRHKGGIFLKHHITPALVLVFLAPMLAELLSGHQSPVEFFNPLNFLILSFPYGCGALLCREIIIRWRKGRLSLVLLGIAYGMFEEGIVVRSIFNPEWPELENIGMYSHVAGVTWTYAILLLHFHVIVSILAGVILTEILFPDQRDEEWVSNRILYGCLLVLLLWIPAGVLMTAYFPSVQLYSAAWIIIIGLIWMAKKVPTNPLIEKRIGVPSPFWFWLLGCVNTPVIFLSVFFTADYNTPPLPVTILFLLIVEGLTFWLILRWSGNGYAWDDRHRLALVAGFLTFFIYACIEQDLESFRGSSIVAIMAIFSLWKLRNRVNKRLKKS
jgi:hypothetical protein